MGGVFGIPCYGVGNFYAAGKGKRAPTFLAQYFYYPHEGSLQGGTEEELNSI